MSPLLIDITTVSIQNEQKVAICYELYPREFGSNLASSQWASALFFAWSGWANAHHPVVFAQVEVHLLLGVSNLDHNQNVKSATLHEECEEK